MAEPANGAINHDSDIDDPNLSGLVALVNGILTDVHAPSLCAGQLGGCWIHNPKPSSLSTAPVRWREDKSTAERICSHGTAHPDLQDAAYWWTVHRRDVTIHGCDGCCGPRPGWADGLLP
jgi:hypothetical protein